MTGGGRVPTWVCGRTDHARPRYIPPVIPTTIRPMRPADVDAATAIVLAGDWGDRREFFSFVTAHAACRPIVAERDGELVGTGVGTVNGPVGWIGTIFVANDARGRGLGRALTEAVQDRLRDAGCRTEVLVATSAGRPLYERLGFEEQCWYRTVEAPGTNGTAAAAIDSIVPVVRAFLPEDLPEMADLDRAATGEDRRHLLRAFANQSSAKCLVRPDGTLRGFVVRAPWGGGATVAVDNDDAFRLLEARRQAAGPAKTVRAGVVDLNAAGISLLERAGWNEAWRAVRMVRGDPLRWAPERIWGQFNHALG